MKNDDLKKFVSEHRQEFDFREPDPGMWDKIKQKSEEKNKVVVESTEKKGRVINLQQFFYKAASVAAIAILSIGIYEYFDREVISTPQVAEVEQTPTEEEIVIPELQEVEHYYNSEINKRMDELSTFTSSDPELKQEVTADMDELDQAYSELKEDLKEAVATEEIIEAMVQNYRLKLEILEEMLHQIKERKGDNNEKPLPIS